MTDGGDGRWNLNTGLWISSLPAWQGMVEYSLLTVLVINLVLDGFRHEFDVQVDAFEVMAGTSVALPSCGVGL
jgi:hypothetical protein